MSPTAKGTFAFAICANFGRNGAPCGRAHQDQPDLELIVHRDHLRQDVGGGRHDHEGREQGQHDEPDISERLDDLAERSGTGPWPACC